LAKDDTVQTRRFVDSLMVRFPLTYYDFRGRQIFGDTVASVLSVSDSVWHSRIDSIPRAETKGRNLSGSGDLDNLLLGIFLGTMGLKEEAELLFEPLQSQNQRNFPLVLSLSRFYNKIGLHYNSYRLARRLYWALPSNQRGEFSPEYLNLFYPTAYAREVKASAERHDVDPHLVWAVMRQESMFSPTILSPVGAVGLMQIMPNTGKEIARDLRISSFEASHLLDPELNVDFGVYYLGKRFGQTQDYVQTLAAYNGGLHNVRRWVRSNQDIIDDEPLFVEYIGFSETRNYVKLVLENYWMYKLIQP
jgi:soluble lytic murein transglycosylase